MAKPYRSKIDKRNYHRLKNPKTIRKMLAYLRSLRLDRFFYKIPLKKDIHHG